MVIKVSFARQIDAQNLDSPLVLTKFFEIKGLTKKSTIIDKLKEMGWRFDAGSLAIKIHDQNAVMMRDSGIVVPRIIEKPLNKQRLATVIRKCEMTKTKA